jgi:DNA-binding GntR family transcriptional regulator
LADNIAESLRDAILRGRFTAGERLAEAKLAGSLQVSRGPVREALAALEQEGLVTRTAAGSATVSHLSQRDVEEICTLRLPLEILAVQLACQKATEVDLAMLEDNVRSTERLYEPTCLAESDLEFHEMIVRAADHSRLLSSWLNLRSQICLIMLQRNLKDAGSRRGTVLGHKDLLNALVARDPAAAVTVLQHHLRKQYEWIMSTFAQAKTEPPDETP